MFNSSVLDVAIGVAFVFLLVSTVCSAIREAIEHLLKTRAAYLEYAIRELLRDREGKGLAREFFDHPLVSALYPGDYKPRSAQKPTMWPRAQGLPSYIPSRTFAMTLLDLAARGPVGEAQPNFVKTSHDSLRASVAKMQNPYVQRALVLALDSSEGNLDKARQQLEAWYDGAMDRVSGWYKRATQAIIFLIALAVTVVGNLDAIAIASRLYSDPAVRSMVVAAAGKDVDHAYATLQSLGLPIGWDGQVTPHLLGWSLTAFAATLGAPFWFDILNKVMVIRSTVKPHEKSREEASEDRQLPVVMQRPADNDQKAS